VADLPDWAFDGLHFDEQITDFFEKVVKVVRAKHIGEPRGFQVSHVLAASRLWNKVQDANAGAIRRRNARELAQDNEGVTVDPCQNHIRNHERPFPGLQLREEHFGVGDDPDSPSLGIQDLFDRARALGIVVEDENAHLLGNRCGTSTHDTKYTLNATDSGKESRGCDVWGKGALVALNWRVEAPLLADCQRGARDVFLQADAIPEHMVSGVPP